MTDGHLYFDSGLYFQGRRPAINVFLSVTRVGKQTQSPLLRDLAVILSKFLKTYEELQRFLRFQMELSASVRQTINHGEKIYALFNQIDYVSIPVAMQVFFVGKIWLDQFDYSKLNKYLGQYYENNEFKSRLNNAIDQSMTFNQFIKFIEKDEKLS